MHEVTINRMHLKDKSPQIWLICFIIFLSEKIFETAHHCLRHSYCIAYLYEGHHTYYLCHRFPIPGDVSIPVEQMPNKEEPPNKKDHNNYADNITGALNNDELFGNATVTTLEWRCVDTLQQVQLSSTGVHGGGI